jgi:hypothetical protein
MKQSLFEIFRRMEHVSSNHQIELLGRKSLQPGVALDVQHCETQHTAVSCEAPSRGREESS